MTPNNYGLIKRMFVSVSDFVYTRMEKGSGSMILLTGLAAILLSMIAQTGAILTNKKYTTSQKAFMIPQEFAEGFITALSMFLITKPAQKFGDSFVKRGKILTNDMKKYMNKHNITEKMSKPEFNLENSIKEIIAKVENSGIYKAADKNTKNKLMNEHNTMLQTYYSVYDTTSAIVTTAGGVLSTAFISPILRNYAASDIQKKRMEIYKKQAIGDSNNYSSPYKNTSGIKI